MRVERDKLQKVNTQMKNDVMTHEQDTNKQMDLIIDETRSFLTESDYSSGGIVHNDSTRSSTIKKHVEYLVKKQDDQLYKMLHETIRTLHRTRSTWTLTTSNV
jgi:hypothetical protein